MACDLNFDNVIITGDLNLNMNIPASKAKIDSMCLYNSLNQCIKEPTHFTKTSSSIIDIVLVKNFEQVLLSGVGEPFLDQVSLSSLLCP